MEIPTRGDLYRLADAFDLSAEEVTLIAINRYGVRADTSDERVRFVLRLPHEDEFYFAVCVNTGPTPFSLDSSGKIWFDDLAIGRAVQLERDTCDSTYFRREGTELTLNSNSRSRCKGCAFCGTYSLDAHDEESFSTPSSLHKYLLKLIQKEGLYDFSHLVRITVCTGCFRDEMAVVDHISMVYDVFSALGFQGRMRYIGAQLGVPGLRALAGRLSTFSLSYTVECFTEREKLLHPRKSKASLESVELILRQAQDLGFGANFLYVLGLEELDVVEAGFRQFAQSVNRFPVVQILQRYTRDRSDCATAAAQNLAYFLSARQMLEAVFADCPLRPRIWENYRGLWYQSYRDEELSCVRM